MIIKPSGIVELKIEYVDSHQFTDMTFNNQILDAGKKLLANALIKGKSSDNYIKYVLFGDGGWSDEANKREIHGDTNSLFGITRIKKEVISQIDPELSSQAIMTFSLARDEANYVPLSEMALQMNNGDLFSIAIFPHMTKTERMKLTYNWKINII